MKTFNEFMSIINEDVDVATIKKMSEDQFQELLRRSNPSRRNQLNAMRQTSSVRMKDGQTSGGSRVTTSDTRPSSSASLTRGGTPITSTTRPSLLRRAANQFDPSKATTRRGSVGRIGNRLAGTMAADFAANQAINQIPDQKTREGAKALKDLGVDSAEILAGGPYLGAVAGVAKLQGSSRRDAEMSYGDSGYTFSKPLSGYEKDTPEDHGYIDRFFRTGGTDAKPTYNDPKQRIMAYNANQRKKALQDPRFTREYIPNPKSNPLNPFNQYMIKNPNYKKGSNEKLFNDYDTDFRVGAARENGQIIPVEWGSVAGIKKVGTPQDVAAVKARQRAGQQGSFGSRRGVGIVGTGSRTTVNRQNNTITSGGRTAKLPSTKILAGGRVGDLAYKNGKPVYLARADMSQRGNQGLFARLSRATGIGGQRERDAAALAREREQALKNTLNYRRQIGAGGGSISAK